MSSEKGSMEWWLERVFKPLREVYPQPRPEAKYALTHFLDVAYERGLSAHRAMMLAGKILGLYQRCFEVSCELTEALNKEQQPPNPSAN